MARIAGHKSGLVKAEVVQTALNLFLERGYSNTYPRMVASALGISVGSITYYFPTKEHILAVLIEMLADYQWQVFQEAVDDGETPITALGLELIAMAAMCEDSEIAKDLYISAYTSELSLSIIRKTDCMRAKKVFAEFRPDWTDAQFAAAETMVSGIEYAVLRVTPDAPSLELRFATAMDTILRIYGVPEERRSKKIAKILSMDYRKYGQQILDGFKKHVDTITHQHLEDVQRVATQFDLKYAEE